MVQSFKVIENTLIPLSDGRRLSARIWVPDTASSHPVPAILEYLPYRKRDGTAQRDDCTYPGFAKAGYAGVRVDISGTGESDGDYDDEYSPRELADGLEVIAWIAGQDWCDGNVGMMGISWGGFNSLQLAALRPPALKAVISIGSTVDRYNNDIHYKNGCHLYSNFSWSSVMLCFASRPPDPKLVGARWKEMWLHRLQTQPFPLEIWLEHQRRDDYWRHGSISEDYGAIVIPVLIMSGWADGYINAPPTLAEHGESIVKAINGPWIHKYPHFAWPRPRMDFVGRAVDWWDRWLKGVENGVEQLPAYTAFMQENVRPGGRREQEEGKWVAEAEWPSTAIAERRLFPTRSGGLADEIQPDARRSISSPEDCGTRCGEFFTLKPDSETSGDQREDDAGSLIFETGPLSDPLQFLGRPVMNLDIAIDQPNGNIAVRLIDVHPDGTGHRVSWNVLNLAHRRSHESPEAMQPGQREEISISLNHCAYRFLPGHRIRVAISTAYWPMIMPSPYRVNATVVLGEYSFLTLPVRLDESALKVDEPTDPDPLPKYRNHRPADHRRVVEKDLQAGVTRYRVFDDTGEDEIPDHGMRLRHTHEECWSIKPDDPLSATATSTYSCFMQRDDWQIRTVSISNLRCDRERYYLDAKVLAYEDDKLVNERSWERVIDRDWT